MIATCQKDISSTVINNGNMSDFMNVSCGLRQGCPLSCLTFLCIIETLGCKIRQDQNIKGVDCGNNNNKKLAQYADDLWIVMLHKKECYDALFKILSAFYVFIKVNYDKTEMIRIGSLCNTNAKYYSEFPLIWTDGPIKILGLICTGDSDKMRNINFSITLQKAEDRLKIWSKRSLSLLGKILVVNTLVIPLFLYRLLGGLSLHLNHLIA